MVHIAHQFLSKPCDGRELQQVIEHACHLQELLEQPALRQIVAQMGRLPAKPVLYSRLVQVLENPNSSMADLYWPPATIAWTSGGTTSSDG